ncbi:hypothetical protein Vafri_15974 [Volvox africanus]|nr:hypothetical protein Vafri_15974 [Volvox africanus]
MAQPIPVWLDCDPGHDDATAILLAGHTPGLRLLGISTIGGNQTLAKVTQNALDVLDALGLSHIGVVAGQPRPLMRLPLLCPEIHGDSGLDGPGGGRLLRRSARKPLPGKAVNVMFAAIAAAYEELQLCENHSGSDADGGAGGGGVGGDGGAAADGSADSCRSGGEGGPEMTGARQQGPAAAVYTAEEPAPQGPEAAALREHAAGQVPASRARRVRLVCTGALTNAALLLTVYPEVADWLEVAIMGGCMGVGNTGPVVEFNIQTDPEAAKIVFESGVLLTMVPLEVTHTVLANPQVLEAIGRGTGTSGATSAAAAAALPMLSPAISPFRHTIQQLLLFFAESYRAVFHFEYPPLHDPVAVAWMIRPSMFECRRMRVDVETCSSLSYGQTVCDIWGQSSRPANVNVALKVDVEGFWELLLAAVARADAVSPLNCGGSAVGGGGGSGGPRATSATVIAAVAVSDQP